MHVAIEIELRKFPEAEPELAGYVESIIGGVHRLEHAASGLDRENCARGLANTIESLRRSVYEQRLYRLR